MLSTELRLLIECCKMSVSGGSEKDLAELIDSNKLDWGKLKKMVVYHGIRPLVYEAVKRISSSDINPDFLHYLNDCVKIKAVQNLLLTHEFKRIEGLFEQNNIQALAFKGISWSNYLYPSSFRECSDIDYLIAKKDTFLALDLLLKDGYQIKAENAGQYSPETLLSALQESGQIEVTLIKNSHHNFEIHLDFHWDLLIQAQNLGFQVDELFADNFSTPEKVLLIMLMHHGKRESWTKLKFVCDLLLFVQKHGNEIDWDSFIEKIERFALKKSLFTGLSVINLFLPVIDTISFSYPLEKMEPLIIKSWEKADFYNLSFGARINFVRLLFKDHRDFAESWYYFVNYVRYLSYPNPREKRLFIFAKERTSLNLMSKIVSYFYFYISTKNCATYP